MRTLDRAFETYARWIPALESHFRAKHPKSPEDSDGVYRSVIRAKALDTLRGLLPAATPSNLGIFGTGQAFEALLQRMFAHPLAEVRAYAALLLEELRRVIPAFMARVDQPNRGGRSIQYLEDTRKHFGIAAHGLLADLEAEPRDEVTLTDFDPDGEVKVVAAALYASSDLPDDQLQALARRLSAADRAALLRAYVGDRANRRHKPGRAFERTSYRFDVLTDYGPSATSSVIDCSRSNGSRSAPATAIRSPRRSRRLARSRTGGPSCTSRPSCTKHWPETD